MENNLFDFATKELSQDAFLCWCLNWNNDSTAPLYPMAEQLLMLLGETALLKGQELVIRRQVKRIDILVILPQRNHVLIIEDKTNSSEHDEQIANYRKTIETLSPAQREEMGIGPNAQIRTVYFKTGFHFDNDKATNADKTVTGAEFLAVLERYTGRSEILDDYVSHLRGVIEWEKEHGRYCQQPFPESFWEWNISLYHIAQYHLMQDLLRGCVDSAFLIQHGANGGGRPRTELEVFKGTHPNSEDVYWIFWRIDTNSNGPYFSLRFYEKFDKEQPAQVERHARAYEKFREKAKTLLEQSFGAGFGWKDVSGGYTGGYYESSILTISLTEPLQKWAEMGPIIQKQVQHITAAFANCP